MKTLRNIQLSLYIGFLLIPAACNRAQEKEKAKEKEAEPRQVKIDLGLPENKEKQVDAPWKGKGIRPSTVAAYEELGGTYGGWVKDYQGKVNFQAGQINAETGLPGFLFRVFPKKQDNLPEVSVSFGLELVQANVSDTRLKELAHLKNLVRLDLPPAKVTDETLRSLGEIGLLHALFLASKADGTRPKSAAEVHRLQLNTTRVKDTAIKELAPFKNLAILDLAPDQITDATLSSLREIGLLQALSQATKQGKSHSAADVNTLSLHSTRVTDAGFKELADLTNLTRLDLGNSKLTGAGLKELAHLKNLTWLNLTGTKVTDAELKSLAQLKNLNFLYMQSCRLVTDETLKTLAGLKNLAHLQLDYTGVTGVGLQELAPLTKLNTLYLGGLQATELKGLPPLNLSILWVGGAKLTDGSLNSLAACKELTHLYLISSHVTEAGLKDLAQLNKLAVLDLTNTNVTDAEMKDLVPLQLLNNLTLNRTKITDVGLKDLAQMKSLQRLDLSSTKVSDVGLKELTQLRNLRWLNLTGTKVTYGGVTDLRVALPDCKIIPEVPAN